MFILRTYSGESMDSKIVTVQLYSSRFYRGSPLPGWCVDVLPSFRHLCVLMVDDNTYILVF